MEIQFDNYTLRLARMDDLPGYFHLIENNRKRLEDFFAGTVAITQTLEDTEAHLADVTGKAEKKNYFPFVLIDNSCGQLIGSMQIKNIDWSIPKAELGYYIDEHYEGRGLVSRTMAFIIDFGFTELHMNKLYLRTYEGNIASRKVAEKNGFSVEGILRYEYKTSSGRIVDLMYYGLLNTEYKRS